MDHPIDRQLQVLSAVLPDDSSAWLKLQHSLEASQEGEVLVQGQEELQGRLQAGSEPPVSILVPLVLLLKDQRPSVAKNALDILKTYAEVTRKAPAVLDALLEHGVRSDHWRLRHQALQSLVPILQTDLSAAHSRMGQVKAVLEDCKEDSNEGVAECARSVYAQVKSLPHPLLALVRQGIHEIDAWKNDANKIYQLEKMIESSKVDDLEMLVEEILEFFKELLHDSNFKVTNSVLNSCCLFAKHRSFVKVCKECLQKLGDNKVGIRQSASKALKVCVVSQLDSVLNLFEEALKDKNWHIREEAVALLMNADSTKFEMSKLVPLLASLLEDPVPKIRFAAAEGLTLCAKDSGNRSVLNKLNSLVSPGIFKAMKDKIGKEVVDSENAPSSAPEIKKPISRTTVSKKLSNLSTPSNERASPKEAGVYLHKGELLPLESPENVLQCLFANDDWAVQFESLNKLRQILQFHSSLITREALHFIVSKVATAAESLRSSLSKNALIVIGEMAESLGKSIDIEMNALCRILLKKVGDTNSFITNEASSSLLLLSRYCCDFKLITNLLVPTKNAATRAHICKCFGLMFDKHNRVKEIPKIVKVLGSYVADASPVVRENARKAFQSFKSSKMYDYKVLTTNLPDPVLKKVIEIPTKEVKKFALKKQLTDPQNTLASLEDILNFISTSDEDLKLDELLEEILPYTKHEDGTIQVFALNCFLKITRKTKLEPGVYFKNLVEALNVTKKATELIKVIFCSLVSQHNPDAVLPAVISIFPKAASKSKSVILGLINQIIPEASNSVLQKHVVPLALKLLKCKKPGSQLVRLIQLVYSKIGDTFFDVVSSETPAALKVVKELAVVG